jgi:hypothetical protein
MKRVINIAFRILDFGLPWRDLPGTQCCRCNSPKMKAIELSSCMPGLGQGFRIILVHYFASNNIDEVVKSGQKD